MPGGLAGAAALGADVELGRSDVGREHLLVGLVAIGREARGPSVGHGVPAEALRHATGPDRELRGSKQTDRSVATTSWSAISAVDSRPSNAPVRGPPGARL